MKNSHRIAMVFTAASVCFAQSPAPADEKAKAVAEAKAKQNARSFENNATVITFYDRSGKTAGRTGERALYEGTVLSPDRTRVAVIKDDLANESTDVWVIDVATGGTTRITTSVKTEFVTAVVWSPDASQLAYVTIRSGSEGIYRRASNGQGPEELLYKNPGAFLDLSDWSQDGRFLTFSKSDLAGGVLYILPLAGGAERKAVEVFRSDLRLFGSRFSPDGRFLSYVVSDQAGQGQKIFVRPVDSAAGTEPWQISDGSRSAAFWRRDGKELYYVGLDRSVMVAEVGTSPAFTFTKPKLLFRPPGAVPDRIAYISSDGERFLALPPPRGPQLQQISILDRAGKVVKKVGEPGLYGQVSFSPDGNRLVLLKNDLNRGQQDIWTLDIETGKGTQVTNDMLPRFNLTWSPDGSQILYVSLRKGDFGVYRRPSDGTGSEELLFRYTPGAGLTLTDISRDGKTLICESGGVILAVPLTGSDPLARKAIESVRDEFDNFVGRLSPDGRFMAFRSDEAVAERFEVYVRPFDASKGMPGEGKWRVSKDGANGMLTWRGDGKEFFFRGRDLDSNDLLLMSVDVNATPMFHAETPRLLFRLPGPVAGNLGNISRDGQRFVFAINVPAGPPAH